MDVKIETYFTDEAGQEYHIGNVVSIKWHNGGGMGSCKITKITKTGFHYTQGYKEKSIQFADILKLSLHRG